MSVTKEYTLKPEKK